MAIHTSSLKSNEDTQTSDVLQAQSRIDQINSFQQELSCLEANAGLTLSNEQQESINSYHRAIIKKLSQQFDLDLSVKEKQLSWGMKIASLLGALAMAAGLFFLFYRFWGEMSTSIQVFCLVAASTGSLGLTCFLKEKGASAYYCKISALVSLAALVLNITMLGDIFNLTPSPNAILVWSAYAVLLAYYCRARLLIFFAVVGVLNFIAMKVGTWSGIYWISFGERPENFILPAIMIFSLPKLISKPAFRDFDPIYRVTSLISLFIPVLILSNFGAISYLPLSADAVEIIYQVIGFTLASGIIWLGIKMHWRDTVNTGVVFFVLFLYTKFFDWWWDLLPKYIFFFVIGAISIGLLALFTKIRNRHKQGMAQVFASNKAQ
ncbi:MAG: DUF2157 domain-containing protein [Kangiellaceae bacterium]|nr:DUF2157 domain-containing protein [Kangiellaceae bacterium]MCW8999297.1 DUF2157 domain-containing protein [Kangiellaceae bacterium]